MSSTAKWKNKLCYILTMEYYSAEKESELLIQTTQVNLSCIMLSERSHILKKKEKKNLYGNLRWALSEKTEAQGRFNTLWRSLESSTFKRTSCRT